MEIGPGENRESLRRRNLSTVLEAVHRAGLVSRAALTTATGLNRSTVAALVADLSERGLVEEGEAVSTGTVGRPSPVVRPSTRHVAVLAADLEVATLTVAVAGLGGHLLRRVQIDRPGERRTVEATVEDLGEQVDAALEWLGGSHQILGLCVSVPGVVRHEDGFVHVAPNVDWADVPLGDLMRARVGGDMPVTLGNDADLGALAEHVRGAGVGVDHLVYIASEIGVGGGIIVDGRPLAGAAGYAGEIGHICVDRWGAECHCGARGCLEAETGEWALLRLMGRSAEREREAAEEVLREAADASGQALDALDTIGGHLGVALADLINVLNPHRVVLGGFFARAFPYLEAAVWRYLNVHAQRPSRQLVSVVPATLGEDSTLLGAVELALAPLLADPTIVAPLEEVDGLPTR